MTVLYAVLSGVLIYLVGQFAGRFVLDPLYEQGVAIRTVNELLMLYADTISNPGVTRAEHMDEASQALRQAASTLRARADAVPFYRNFADVGLIRSREEIREACGNLIGLSNSIHQGDGAVNGERAVAVRRALGLEGK